jgi:cardiolipin synthase (CMP-forming)
MIGEASQGSRRLACRWTPAYPRDLSRGGRSTIYSWLEEDFTTLTVATLITLLRFVLVPMVVLALLSERVDLALVCFVVAGVSDAIDGFIARRFNQHTELGAYLDPMADKLLLVSVFVVLGFMRELPLWLVVTAVSRDALIVAGVLLSTVMHRPVAMKPLMVSKVNTAVQIVLAALVLGELALETAFGPARTILIFASGALTVASAAAYLVGWLRHMSGHGDDATSNR